MRVADVVAYTAWVNGVPSSECAAAAERAVAAVALTGKRGERVRALSGGQRQRLGIAAGLAHDPDVLVLDEPTVGLDPEQRWRMRDVIAEIGKSRTVVLSSHLLDEVAHLCQRVGVLARGRLVFDGTVRDLEHHATSPSRLDSDGGVGGDGGVTRQADRRADGRLVGCGRRSSGGTSGCWRRWGTPNDQDGPGARRVRGWWWPLGPAVVVVPAGVIVVVVLVMTWPMLGWPYPLWVQTSAEFHQQFTWAGLVAGTAACWYAIQFHPRDRIWVQPWRAAVGWAGGGAASAGAGVVVGRGVCGGAGAAGGGHAGGRWCR